jgi:hypothetical protein
LLFTQEPRVSLTEGEETTEIADIIIGVKSKILKDENVWIPLEYQLAYPNIKSVKVLSDGLLTDKYMISRKQFGL